MRIQIIFECWFCGLPFYSVLLLVLTVLLLFCVCECVYVMFKILHIRSCYLLIEITTSFWIWMLLISFFWLITLDKTFHAMLNRSGKSGHPCLTPDLGEKSFGLHYYDSFRFLIHGLYYVLSLVTVFDLKSFLSDINITVFASCEVPFARNIFSTPSLLVYVCFWI